MWEWRGQREMSAQGPTGEVNKKAATGWWVGGERERGGRSGQRLEPARVQSENDAFRGRNISMWSGLSCCLLMRRPWAPRPRIPEATKDSFHAFLWCCHLGRRPPPDCSRRTTTMRPPPLLLLPLLFFCLYRLESLLSLSRYFNYMVSLPRCHLLNHWSTEDQ